MGLLTTLKNDIEGLAKKVEDPVHQATLALLHQLATLVETEVLPALAKAGSGVAAVVESAGAMEARAIAAKLLGANPDPTPPVDEKL
jgi:hypothetical protein